MDNVKMEIDVRQMLDNIAYTRVCTFIYMEALAYICLYK